MKFPPVAKYLTFVAVVLSVLSGCAMAPTQEMSDARQAIQAARDAGADKYAKGSLATAQGLLAKAETALEDGDYEAARNDAVAAKTEAVKARNMALAIGDAAAALKQAGKLGAAWRDSKKMLDKATAAADKGDEKGAIKMAAAVKAQAENAINQYYLESAKMMIWAADERKGEMSADQMARLEAARKAYRNQDGKKAYDGMSSLMAELGPEGGADAYSVVRGDSLWGISGKSEIYNNPYQWPLIYKANADQIKDADLIYPGQALSISRGDSMDDVAAAVKHAKTRGAWSLGNVEVSDRAYLAR